MKKTNIKKFVIISTSIVFAIITLLSFSFKKPFRDIEISSVKRISVYNYEGTNTTHELTDGTIIDFAVYGDYFVLDGKKYDSTNDIILDEIDNLYNDNTFQSN